MKSLRVPMFVKFLLGCLTLAALLIVGGTAVVKNQARPSTQGNFLAKHLRRFQGYEERVGRGMTGVLEVVADDPRVRRAFGHPTAAPAPAAPAPDASADLSPAAVGESLAARLSSKNGINPDLLALFTVKEDLLWASSSTPIKKSDLADLAPVERVQAGSIFAHLPVLIDGVPYQVSAVPVRSTDGELLGGVLAGVRLARYYVEYAEQSDDNADNRMRPTLIHGQEILATAFPDEQRSAVAQALQLDKVFKVNVGEEQREVVRIGSTAHYFYGEDLLGYKGLEKTTLGKLFITRVQPVTDDGSKIPWPEIGIAVALSVGIALLMAFWITRPIKQFVSQSKKLLEGDTDLTQRIVVRSNDETADLAENINQVFSRVQGLASGVQTAAFQVGASSAEISAASKQMLSGIKDQSLKIESSTAAITELSASIQQVAENAAHATDVASKSNVAVTSAVERMEQIRGAVDEAAEKMRELGDSSKRIGKIVEVIRQISEQTSLLALNAAIQAAQAGEHGRGFAVVADEVSSLARRSGESAKDIESLIQSITEQTSAAVSSMEKGAHEVESGTELVSATLGDLGQLIGVVRDTARAVQEQAVVSDEIARNMDAVQLIANEVLTGSEESVVQAERLHELAYDLEETIGGFNLDGGKRSKAVSAEVTPKPRALPDKTERSTKTRATERRS